MPRVVPLGFPRPYAATTIRVADDAHDRGRPASSLVGCGRGDSVMTCRCELRRRPLRRRALLSLVRRSPVPRALDASRQEDDVMIDVKTDAGSGISWVGLRRDGRF
jgi:hypothetical protein